MIPLVVVHLEAGPAADPRGGDHQVQNPFSPSLRPRGKPGNHRLALTRRHAGMDWSLRFRWDGVLCTTHAPVGFVYVSIELIY